MPPATLLGDQDFYLFNEGSHRRLYEKLGAHRMRVGGEEGTYFAVWAPNANRVAVIGELQSMEQRKSSTARPRKLRHLGRLYPRRGTRRVVQVSHRFAFPGLPRRKSRSIFYFQRNSAEEQPRSSGISIINGATGQWMRSAAKISRLNKPISIYEVHLGSWRRVRGGATARCLIESWRRAWRITCIGWDTLTWSLCRSWIIRFSAHGAIRSPVTLRLRVTMARRRI